MTDYQMPVLSEQEREEQVQYCCARESSLLAQIESYKQFDGVDSIDAILQKDLISQQIALAALTAKPVAFTEKHEISNMHATGLYLRAWPTDRARNEVEGYTVGVYTMPPVPVKQEGGLSDD